MSEDKQYNSCITPGVTRVIGSFCCAFCKGMRTLVICREDENDMTKIYIITVYIDPITSNNHNQLS